MAKRKIMSVGLQFPSDEVEYIEFASNRRSLLDADLIIFRPLYYAYSTEEYKGKPILRNSAAFAFKQTIEHWNQELNTAFNEGKTIVIILSKPRDFYIDETQTPNNGPKVLGRNSVRLLSTYASLPIEFEEINSKSGSEIYLTTDAKFLSAYWNDFSSLSSYEMYFEGNFSKILLTTKTGGKVVGAVVKDKGTILLLPNIDFNVFEDDEEIEELYQGQWTEEEITQGNRFINHVVEFDKYFRRSLEKSIQPAWLQDESFDLKEEILTKKEIKQTEFELAQLQTKLTDLGIKLNLEGSLRRLLYDQGHDLEDAIIEALKIMGFTVERYQDDQSEFDAIFVSAEGRFLGEAEGKDNKPINIDKFSQLERNIHEDFAREEVTEHAKGVLFGNAYRLTGLAERGDYFTTKCLKAAERTKIALVCTPDLFFVARYLKENTDEEFARVCREAMKNAEGTVVKFPPIPQNE